MRKLTLTVTHRADGRVCKRINGQIFYWPDEETARKTLVEMIRGRAGGSVPAAVSDPDLRTVANLYRAQKRSSVSPGTWDDYEEAIDSFLAIVGKYKRLSDLLPADFGAVRSAWGSKLGPWRLDNRVQAIRTMFRWSHGVARITGEPWYGDKFGKTTLADKRRERRKRAAVHGDRVFTRAELKKILNNVTGPLRAFTLLAINGGMDAAGIAEICKADIRKEGVHWLIDNDRGKTGVRRKFALWPETVNAVRETIDKGDGPLAFLTQRGNAWVRGEINSIVMLYTQFLDGLKIKRPGVNFGALKHTHVSAVGESGDINAARLVRGHKFSGIEGHYDFPTLDRIKAITDLARRRLFTFTNAHRPSRPQKPQPSREQSRSQRQRRKPRAT